MPFAPFARRRRRPAVTGARFARIPTAVLDLLPDAVLVVDEANVAVLANSAAQAMRLTRGDRLAISELRRLAGAVRRDGRPRRAELDLPGRVAAGRVGAEGPLAVRARLASLGGKDVALLVEDLTESRRLARVRRDFTVNAGHELKTPVAALRLLAEAVMDAQDDPATVRQFAGRIRAETERLANLVQEIIDLGRAQDDQPVRAPQEVAVGDVVDQAVARVQMAAQGGAVRIEREVQTGLRVRGDAAALTTMLSNLLDNAVAYSPSGTAVRLSVQGEGDTLLLRVADQGVGIAGEDLDRIFERFYRVDPARARSTGGSGLGLAIVKHVVAAHQGTVTVESAPGVGSTFTVCLPLAEPSGQVAAPV